MVCHLQQLPAAAGAKVLDTPMGSLLASLSTEPRVQLPPRGVHLEAFFVRQMLSISFFCETEKGRQYMLKAAQSVLACSLQFLPSSLRHYKYGCQIPTCWGDMTENELGKISRRRSSTDDLQIVTYRVNLVCFRASVDRTKPQCLLCRNPVRVP